MGRKEAMKIAARRHDELTVDLTLRGILGESDLARLLGRDMAEMLFVLLLIPGLLMPGRRRIGSVGEAQLFANRPVDVADVGAGQRDSELRIGRAEEKQIGRASCRERVCQYV